MRDPSEESEGTTAVYRVTVRHGTDRQRYEVFEVEADSIAAALRLVAERIPERAHASADLVELRRANPAE